MRLHQSLKKSPRFLLLISCILLSLLSGGIVSRTQSCTQLDGTVSSWPRGSTVYVNLGNLNAEQRRQITAAVMEWNRVNQTNGSYVTFSFDLPPNSTAFTMNFQIGQTFTDPNTG